jgi:hypothetical protein
MINSLLFMFINLRKKGIVEISLYIFQIIPKITIEFIDIIINYYIFIIKRFLWNSSYLMEKL